jgi:hypothetical protein
MRQVSSARLGHGHWTLTGAFRRFAAVGTGKLAQLRSRASESGEVEGQSPRAGLALRGRGPLKSGGPAARRQRHGGIHCGKLASVTVGPGRAVPVLLSTLSRTMTMKAVTVAVTVCPLARGLPLAVSDGTGPEFPEPAGGLRSSLRSLCDGCDRCGRTFLLAWRLFLEAPRRRDARRRHISGAVAGFARRTS